MGARSTQNSYRARKRYERSIHSLHVTPRHEISQLSDIVSECNRSRNESISIMTNYNKELHKTDLIQKSIDESMEAIDDGLGK